MMCAGPVTMWPTIMPEHRRMFPKITEYWRLQRSSRPGDSRPGRLEVWFPSQHDMCTWLDHDTNIAYRFQPIEFAKKTEHATLHALCFNIQANVRDIFLLARCSQKSLGFTHCLYVPLWLKERKKCCSFNKASFFGVESVSLKELYFVGAFKIWREEIYY